MSAETSRDLPVGDLLEAGSYSTLTGTARMRPVPPGSPTETVRAYMGIAPNLMRVCPRGCVGEFTARLSFCLLPEGHDDWPGGTLSLLDGRRHRLYECSARDSAAMLAGMRRRIEA